MLPILTKRMEGIKENSFVHNNKNNKTDLFSKIKIGFSYLGINSTAEIKYLSIHIMILNHAICFILELIRTLASLWIREK